MLLRLVLATLMLTGSVPVRLCTCAPAVRSNTPASHSTHELAGESAACGCKHRTNVSSGVRSLPEAETPHGDSDQTANPPAEPSRHNRECPAVSPRPIVSATVPTPFSDAPADTGVVTFLSNETFSTACPHNSRTSDSRPSRGAVPLYLSLLSIRI
jgi:hypothetical protein